MSSIKNLYKLFYLICVLNIIKASLKKSEIIGDGDTRSPSGGFPFMISLEMNEKHICGGTILNRWMILTAAHCIYKSIEIEENPWFRIRAGSLIRENGGEVINVQNYIMHPKFSVRKYVSYDVALLKLEEPLYFIRGIIERINIAKMLQLPINENGIAIGWGSTEGDNTPLSNYLRNVTIPILDEKSCEMAINEIISEHAVFCAGFLDKGHLDACSGDSGGPLIRQLNRRQIGIISWGRGCAQPHNPGVYTNINVVYDWIIEAIKNLARNLY